MTPERLFKPTVMFFGLTSFLVTFQAIINKILQNLINTKEVTSFINNIIVGIREEKRYDKMIEKIVKRPTENDLYVKPERYKWKVRKVRFLGIVIGSEEIKIKEEKIKGVLDWLALKGVKNIQNFLGLENRDL